MTYSQGGVKVPTGGIPTEIGEPASAPEGFGRSSRSGERPEPTVIVRMEEDKAVYNLLQPATFRRSMLFA